MKIKFKKRRLCQQQIKIYNFHNLNYCTHIINFLGPNVCIDVDCDFICTSGSKGPMCVCGDGSQVEPGNNCDVILYLNILCYIDIHIMLYAT